MFIFCDKPNLMSMSNWCVNLSIVTRTHVTVWGLWQEHLWVLRVHNLHLHHGLQQERSSLTHIYQAYLFDWKNPMRTHLKTINYSRITWLSNSLLEQQATPYLRRTKCTQTTGFRSPFGRYLPTRNRFDEIKLQFWYIVEISKLSQFCNANILVLYSFISHVM